MFFFFLFWLPKQDRLTRRVQINKGCDLDKYKIGRIRCVPYRVTPLLPEEYVLLGERQKRAFTTCRPDANLNALQLAVNQDVVANDTINTARTEPARKSRVRRRCFWLIFSA